MKGFSVKSGFGIGAVIFAVAALIALPLRTVQLFTVIENDGSGFYTANDWSVYALGIVLAASTIAFLVLALIKRKKLDYDREVKPRPVFGIFSLIAAAGTFFDGISCASKFSANFNPIIEVTFDGVPVWNTEKLVFGGEAIFAILTAIFFLAVGLSTLTGKTNGSEHKLISLSPVLWCIVKLVFRFSRTISYLKVSDLAFELIMLVFMVMFFMAFAQVNSQIGDKNSKWKLAGYGLPAALFALICFVPRLIATFAGRTELIYQYSSLDICDLTTALFIISAVFTRITDKAEIPEETNTDKETEEVTAKE